MLALPRLRFLPQPPQQLLRVRGDHGLLAGGEVAAVARNATAAGEPVRTEGPAMRRFDAYEATGPDGTRVRVVSVRRMPTRLLRTQALPQQAADVRLPWGVRAALWIAWAWVATHPPGTPAWWAQAPWVVVTIGGVLLALGLWLDALLHGSRR